MARRAGRSYARREMVRRPRNFVEGIYHVASQASDTRFLFLDDLDRGIFLGGFGVSIGETGV